jgi:serine/threonine protein kinase
MIKKKYTIYKDLLIERVKTVTQLSSEEKQSLIQKIDKLEKDVDAIQYPIDEVKVVKRKKGDHTSLSLRVTDEVPSVKVAPLGSGMHSRVHLSVDGLPGKDEEHIYATKVKQHTLFFDETPENKKHNLMQLAYTEHEIYLLKLMQLYIRHGVRHKGLVTDNKTGAIYRVQKVYIDLKYLPGPSFYQAAKTGEAQGKKISESAALSMMKSISDQLAIIHGAGYFHGDLHRRNLMVTGDLFGACTLTLFDFNLSRPFGQPVVIIPVKPGRHEQIPPECCNKEIVYFNRSSDVYALGNIFKVISGLTACTPELRAAFKAMHEEMRHPNPEKRPTLQHIRQALSALSDRKQGYVPYAVGDQVQKQVIEALESYVHGLKATYSLLDSKRTQKIDFLILLMRDLKNTPALEVFQGKLKQGFLDFLRKFIIPTLSSYRRTLDPDLQYFAKAMQACGEEIDLFELMAQRFTPKVENKLREILIPASPSSTPQGARPCLKWF